MSSNSEANDDILNIELDCGINGDYENENMKTNRLIGESITEFVKSEDYELYKPYLLEKDVWFILGEISGFLLSKRDKNENHIKLTMLSEDDENWFVGERTSMSSYWIDDYKKLVDATNEFLNSNNFIKSQYGYEFK